ncbi:MAG: nitroreductase family protein [Actinobacteria bacterium]|nr:nitroreductase family protein [Actinomycetota bacterium]
MTDCYQLIRGLRAIRDYEHRPLHPEDLDAILEAARWTGSSKNRQDWSFHVVDDPARLQGLGAHGDFTQPIRDSAATIVLVKEPGGNMFDIGRAAQNIMLAAKTRGVASCPVTLHRSDDARSFLGLSSDQVAMYAVALGYATPGAQPRRYGGRKEASQVIRSERT